MQLSDSTPALIEIAHLIRHAHPDELRPFGVPFPVPLELFARAEVEMDELCREQDFLNMTNTEAPLPNFICFGVAVHPQTTN